MCRERARTGSASFFCDLQLTKLLFVWRNTESGGILTDGCDFPGEEVGEVGDF